MFFFYIFGLNPIADPEPKCNAQNKIVPKEKKQQQFP